jgi:hypothetical protein
MMHILFALQSAFSLWMLVDAASRRAGYVWYMIIMMPFGEVAYFLAVKIHDPEFAAFRLGRSGKPPSLDQLRFNAEDTPSFENRLMLARGLHDTDRHREAAELFRQLLDEEPEDKAALYGLGCSLLGAGETKVATQVLEALAELDFKYAEYAAGSMLADIYWQEERREEALALKETLANASRSLAHQTELARSLAELGREPEARALIERCLNEYAHSPGYVQKNEKQHARAARRLLKSLV